MPCWLLSMRRVLQKPKIPTSHGYVCLSNSGWRKRFRFGSRRVHPQRLLYPLVHRGNLLHHWKPLQTTNPGVFQVDLHLSHENKQCWSDRPHLQRQFGQVHQPLLQSQLHHSQVERHRRDLHRHLRQPRHLRRRGTHLWLLIWCL